MVNTDIGGEPILILSLRDVKILLAMVDVAETPDQNEVSKRIVNFINDPACLEWEQKNA